jgi:hypothetical protein
VDLIENTGGYFRAIGKSFSTAAKTFDSNSLPGDKITTFDTMFETGWKAAKAVKASHSSLSSSCRMFLQNVPIECSYRMFLQFLRSFFIDICSVWQCLVAVELCARTCDRLELLSLVLLLLPLLLQLLLSVMLLI